MPIIFSNVHNVILALLSFLMQIIMWSRDNAVCCISRPVNIRHLQLMDLFMGLSLHHRSPVCQHILFLHNLFHPFWYRWLCGKGLCRKHNWAILWDKEALCICQKYRSIIAQEGVIAFQIYKFSSKPYGYSLESSQCFKHSPSPWFQRVSSICIDLVLGSLRCQCPSMMFIIFCQWHLCRWLFCLAVKTTVWNSYSNQGTSLHPLAFR